MCKFKKDVYFEEIAMGTSRVCFLTAHSIMTAMLQDIAVSRSKLLRMKNANGEVVGKLPFNPLVLSGWEGLTHKEGK